MAVTDTPTVEIPKAILEELIFGVREFPTDKTRDAADAAEFILQDASAPKPCGSTLELGSYILECSKSTGHGDKHQDGSKLLITWTDAQARKDPSTLIHSCVECGQKFDQPQSYRDGAGHQTMSFGKRILEEVEPALPVTIDQLKEWRDSAERKRKAAAESISTFVAFARFYEKHRALLEPVLKSMGPSKAVPLKQLEQWVTQLERGSSIRDLVGKFIKD